MSDSTTAGYLLPTIEPTEGEALDNILHDAIVGITGIRGDLVRPRWQVEPPQQPSFDVDWVAFGIPRTEPDVFSYSEQRADGADVSRDIILYVMHSFYGPNSSGNAERLRFGLDVEQNRQNLRELGLLVREVQEPTILPALLKEKWVKRVDITVVYARRATRSYPIVPIESGQMGLDNEHYLTPIQTTIH